MIGVYAQSLYNVEIRTQSKRLKGSVEVIDDVEDEKMEGNQIKKMEIMRKEEDFDFGNCLSTEDESEKEVRRHPITDSVSRNEQQEEELKKW